jgi:coproporphyrinogen III oxidase
MIRRVQGEVCAALKEADGSGARFVEDVWSRPGGGGGISRTLQDGRVQRFVPSSRRLGQSVGALAIRHAHPRRFGSNMFHPALLLIHVLTLSVSILMAAKMACSLDSLENWSDMYLQETGCTAT